jgi:histidinol phosphatase-like enzyme
LGLDINQSLLVGDKETDIQSGRAANLKRTYLIKAFSKVRTAKTSPANGEFPSLLDCAKHIVIEDMGKGWPNQI